MHSSLPSSKTTTALRIGAPLTGEPLPGLQWIEVASSLQIPGFQVIGLPAPEVAEARERVRAAIVSSGLEFPRRRVVLNLSPASIRKRGTGADLAMALAVLQETYGPARSGHVVAWGELGLDGAVKPAGQITCTAYAAWEAGADAVIVAADEYEAARERVKMLKLSRMIEGKPAPVVLPARNLVEAWRLVRGDLKSLDAGDDAAIGDRKTLPVCTGKDQLLLLPPSLERVLGVASTGAHHLLLLGPRGTGKSHALEWLIALQPEPSAEIRVRRALLEELGGALTGSGERVPVRRISPYARPSALLGWAAPWGVRPGELSLAHGGLLLADEFPEWSRDSRECLREPLERGRVTLTRARKSVELPARFMLAANGNLCPCGGWPPELPTPIETATGAAPAQLPRCGCAPGARARYLSRLSGPVLDRLDLVALATHPGGLRKPKPASASERLQALREQVERSRERLLAAWGATPSALASAELEQIMAGHPSWANALDPNRFTSLRSRHKTVRVALSLAAWDGLAEPSSAHFIEAACYRPERYGLVG